MTLEALLTDTAATAAAVLAALGLLAVGERLLDYLYTPRHLRKDDTTPKDDTCLPNTPTTPSSTKTEEQSN